MLALVFESISTNELIIGFIVISFIAFLAVRPYLTKRAINRSQNILTENLDLKICPYCAEQIKSAAIVCRFCGRDLP